jgi:triosephosphate isomerase
VSATELAASARSADEPLSTPATPFTVAMVAFAATATWTVFLLAEATAAPFPETPIRCALVLVAANWKMFKTRAETRAFCDDFHPPEGVNVILCPPFTSLDVAVASGFTVYAQNVHWAREGAFTGEISAPMLLDLGVAGAIVGHSERRRYFGDTDETVARRVVAALGAGLGVIACVGESEEEREAGQTELVLAYEPIWAIGTGRTATPELAAEAHAFVKGILDVPVLYGGSVKPDNAAELLGRDAVDGALVGGASLEVDSFEAICRAAIPS